MPTVDGTDVSRGALDAWSTRRQVVSGAVLALAMTASVIPSATLSVLADFLVRDLGLSHAQIGVLVTTFSLSGAFWSPWAGRLTDRRGGRYVMVLGFLIVGSSVVLLAVMPGFVWMLPVLVFAGFANGASNPATNKVVSQAAPVGQRGTVVGIKQSGVQLAYVLTGLSLPTIALLGGWRLAFASTLTIPLLGLAGTRTLLPREAPVSRTARAKSSQGGRGPSEIWLNVYAFFMGAALGSLVSYLPLYSIQVLGLSAQAAGLLMGVVSFVGVVTRILLGRHGEAVSHYGRLLRTLAVVALLGVLLVWMAGQLSQPWLLWVAGVVLGASLLAWNTIGMLAVMRSAGHARTGRASGGVLSGFLMGFGASPVVFGLSVDVTGDYTVGWAGLLVLLCLAIWASVRWRGGHPSPQHAGVSPR